MPNPGSFKGARKDFLMGEKAAYSASVEGGYMSEALNLIYRRFFKHFAIQTDLMSSEKEPTEAELAAVDDDAPDPEVCPPDPATLSEAEYIIALIMLEDRRRRLDFKRGQIKRWMAYQYMKDNDVDPKETGDHNPYNALLAKLTGREIRQPRRKTPVNVWRKARSHQIDEEVRQKYGVVDRKDLASVRDKVAREMFQSMSEERRHQWEVFAGAEHRRAIEQWREEVDKGPSTDPVDHQRCIQGLVRFVQPILDTLCDATGWKATLIAGGPEPAQDGQLNVISVHSGTTSGDVKMTFRQAERVAIKKMVIPMFGSFLKKCYTPEDCRSRALPASSGYQPVSEDDFDPSRVSIFEVRPVRPNVISTSGPIHESNNLAVPSSHLVSPIPTAGEIIPNTSQGPPTATEPISSAAPTLEPTSGSVTLTTPLPLETAGPVLEAAASVPVENICATAAAVQDFRGDDVDNPFDVEYDLSLPASPVGGLSCLSPPPSPSSLDHDTTGNDVPPAAPASIDDNSTVPPLALPPSVSVIAPVESSCSQPPSLLDRSVPGPINSVEGTGIGTTEGTGGEALTEPVSRPVAPIRRSVRRLTQQNETGPAATKSAKRKHSALGDATAAVNNEPLAKRTLRTVTKNKRGGK